MLEHSFVSHSLPLSEKFIVFADGGLVGDTSEGFISLAKGRQLYAMTLREILLMGIIFLCFFVLHFLFSFFVSGGSLDKKKYRYCWKKSSKSYNDKYAAICSLRDNCMMVVTERSNAFFFI